MNRKAPWQGKNIIKILIISMIGILINMGGAAVVRAFGWPIYLDAIGTALSAGLCGYLPGIVVGLISNLLNGFFDSELFYYAIVNVVFAVITYFFVSHGWIKKIWGFFLPAARPGRRRPPRKNGARTGVFWREHLYFNAEIVYDSTINGFKFVY